MKKARRLNVRTKSNLLRSERRAIEDRVKNVDLEVKRKVDLERREIETNLAIRLEQAYQLRIADKEKALTTHVRQMKSSAGRSSKVRNRARARFSSLNLKQN